MRLVTDNAANVGICFDSVTATFRVPEDKLDKVHERLESAPAAQSISFPSLPSVARQCVSMSVAFRLASQAMFAVLSALVKSGFSRVDLAVDSSADLAGEMKQP